MKLFVIGLSLMKMSSAVLQAPQVSPAPTPPPAPSTAPIHSSTTPHSSGSQRPSAPAHSSAASVRYWEDSYTAGLKAARQSHWAEARRDFKESDQDRKGDIDRATITPGAPGEPLRWRDGAPYSPKFLSAYSEYRIALDSHDADDQKVHFQTAENEFEGLIAMGERSRDTLFFLDLIYTRLDEKDKRPKLHPSGKRVRHGWKVDEEVLAPEEISAMQLADNVPVAELGTVAPPKPGLSPEITAGSLTTGPAAAALNSIVPGLPPSSVPLTGDKFAIVIGEDGSQLGPNAVPFASYDASVMKDALVSYAGYPADNVLLIQNATAPQIMEQAKALASKVTQDAIVLLFFAGHGVSIQGKDFIAASDTTSRFDAETMVPKASLYNLFFLKGARLFSFYEVNRPIENGFYFGSEVVKVGSVSQMEATIPDADITATVANGHMVGVFAQSFVQVLTELRSNRLPIYEFGWQLYNKMRRGNTGNEGGSAHQIPTLPYLNNLASDAHF